MTRLHVFRTLPPDLVARVRFGIDIATLDAAIDGDTVRVVVCRAVGDPGCIDVRIRDLNRHELHDPDPVKRRLAQDEQFELLTLLDQHPLFSVHYVLTRTGQVVMSFTRAVAHLMLPDGRTVTDVLQPLRAARVDRLRQLGLYAPRKEHP